MRLQPRHLPCRTRRVARQCERLVRVRVRGRGRGRVKVRFRVRVRVRDRV